MANLNLASLGEGADRVLIEDRAPGLGTLEPRSPAGSEDKEEQSRTRRNMMVATAQQGERTSSNLKPQVNLEQMRQIVAALS